MPSIKKTNLADWVLKLPPPPNCSVGISNNETIGFDGAISQERRENEDRYLVCSKGDKQLLMVLDGHEGSKAVKFVQTYLPHVLLQKELSGYDPSTMADISSAILATETQFFVSIDPYITRKVTLQIEIEQEVPDMNSSEAANLFPTQIAEICRLDDLIKSGTTVVVALIWHNKLYVANVGDSRALLCLHQPGVDGQLSVRQLTVDHNTRNEDELRRLEKCGLNPVSLRTNGRLGTQQNTRSIGDYSIKGGYTNVDILKHATTEPGTAEPYVHDPINVSACQGFLILMSDGLYKAYEEWSQRPDHINEDIAYLVNKELKNCQGGEDEAMVAQNVVEKVKHLFRDTHKRARTPGRLDDITLIVKRLGLAHSVSTSASQHHQYYSDVSVPQTAPAGVDRVFDFNNRSLSASVNLPPTSYPSHHPTPHLTHQQPPPPTSSYHHTHHHQHVPPPSQPSMPPSASSFQPDSGVPENRQPTGRVGNYGDYRDHELIGGGGGARGDIPYSSPHPRRQGYDYGDGGDYPHARQPGVQRRPDNIDYPQFHDEQYHDGQYWSQRQQQQHGNDPSSVGNTPFSRVGSDEGSRRLTYSQASGQTNPRSYVPQGSYPPESDKRGYGGYQSVPSQDFPGGAGGYSHIQDSGGRQPDGRYPQENYGMQGQGQRQQQQQFVGGGNAGQQYQRDPYQANQQGPNYPPGRGPNQSYRQQENWPGGYSGGQTSSMSGPDPAYHPSGGFAPQTSMSEDAQDLATPVATRQYSFANRQQSGGSLASDTSSSSDLTLTVRPPVMAAVGEVDTLREDELAVGGEVGSSPSLGGASTGHGMQTTADGQGPGTQDSEGPQAVIYVSEDDDEPDNQSLMDNDDVVKPYVKFGERFPANLSWHDIPLVK